MRYKIIYWPYELPMSDPTCTQPRSRVATANMGCGEVPDWYLVAGVAFEAPGSCKQLTPQITPICGGARETTLLYLTTVTHAACANALERYPVHNHSAL